MEREAKKKWLRRYRNQMFKAESCWRQAEEWNRSISEPSSRVLDGTPKASGFKNNIDKSIVKYFELIEEAVRATSEAMKLRREVVDAIERIENDKAVKVLTLRYVEGFSWEKINDKLHYSRSHSQFLHDQGLELLKIGQNRT